MSQQFTLFPGQNGLSDDPHHYLSHKGHTIFTGQVSSIPSQNLGGVHCAKHWLGWAGLGRAGQRQGRRGRSPNPGPEPGSAASVSSAHCGPRGRPALASGAAGCCSSEDSPVEAHCLRRGERLLRSAAPDRPFSPPSSATTAQLHSCPPCVQTEQL